MEWYHGTVLVRQMDTDLNHRLIIMDYFTYLEYVPSFTAGTLVTPPEVVLVVTVDFY